MNTYTATDGINYHVTLVAASLNDAVAWARKHLRDDLIVYTDKRHGYMTFVVP